MQNSGVAYLYFDYKRENEQTIANVIRVLLKQVLLQSDSIPLVLEEAYQSGKALDESMFTAQLIAVFAAFPSSLIIFDALDECNEKILRGILNLIKRLTISGVKVFCTGRNHLTGLEKLLDNATVIQIHAHDEDVRNYLSEQLNKQARFSRHMGEIIESLTNNAKGK